MEPVEHFLFGAALGRAGFNRCTAYATVAMVLAAEAPDLDTLWWLRGPVENLQHHRGWMHSFVGAPIVALGCVGVVWCGWRWQGRKRARAHALPVRWGRLFLLAWLAALSHIFLDWTNNYGVRPFWPFSPRWFEADLVFILEPLMLAVLALAAVAPWLLGLVNGEIGARKPKFTGRGWAWFALAFIGLLWTVRAVEHHRALVLAGQRDWEAGTPVRMGMMPYPITPFEWHAVVDTGDRYQTAHVHTLSGAIQTDPQTDIYYKQAVTPAIARAQATKLSRVYMDWSSWPLVAAEQPEIDDESYARQGTLTPVEFNDLRFDYEILGSRAGKHALGAEVLLGPDGSVVQMTMGGRPER